MYYDVMYYRFSPQIFLKRSLEYGVQSNQWRLDEMLKKKAVRFPALYPNE